MGKRLPESQKGLSNMIDATRGTLKLINFQIESMKKCLDILEHILPKPEDEVSIEDRENFIQECISKRQRKLDELNKELAQDGVALIKKYRSCCGYTEKELEKHGTGQT